MAWRAARGGRSVLGAARVSPWTWGGLRAAGGEAVQQPAAGAEVFDRELKRRHKQQAALLPDSKEFDYLRDEVGTRLLDRIEDILPRSRRRFEQGLDLGSALSGDLLEKLKQHTKLPPIQVAQAEAALYRDAKAEDGVRRIVGSEEHLLDLGVEEQSVDLIVSNLALHWVNDLPGALVQANLALRPDGVLLGSMFGGDTLRELRESFAVAEQERDGGLSPHVSPFAGVSDIGNVMSRAKLQLPTIDTEEITVRFSSAWTLMRELGRMGEANAVLLRRKHTPRSTMLAAAAFYQHYFGLADGSVPATFQIIYMIGWAPHADQPKPKRRGSAQYHLGDLSSVLSESSNQ